MDASFWLSRWEEGKIGFHEGRVNAHLAEHAAVLAGARRVLVPLCGKAVDLAWLAARGHEVVGVELAESAARAFFVEQELEASAGHVGVLPSLSAGGVTIIVGDFFAVSAATLGSCDAFYDRAALIALPPAMRARYAAHLRTLLAPAARGLLITLEYDQTKMDGPPHAVLRDEVHALWGPGAGAQAAELAHAVTSNPRLAELGLAAVERAYRVVLG